MIYRLTTKNRLDKRSLAYKWAEYYKANTNAVHGALVLGTLLALIFAPWIWRKTRPLTFEGVNPTVAAEPTITPTPKPLTWNDAIRQVFPSDEAGRMIRICMTENKAQNRYAINWNKNGTFDYSWCQVNSVHKPKTMTDYEWKQHLEDPTNHAKEVRKIYLSQGWNAWVVYKRGLVR